MSEIVYSEFHLLFSLPAISSTATLANLLLISDTAPRRTAVFRLTHSDANLRSLPLSKATSSKPTVIRAPMQKGRLYSTAWYFTVL
jgi:hypothetical protein